MESRTKCHCGIQVAGMKSRAPWFPAFLVSVTTITALAAWMLMFTPAIPAMGADTTSPNNEGANNRVTQASHSACTLALEVSGGIFDPDFCQFEIISGGQLCPRGTQCKPGYALNLKNTTLVLGEIESVVLFQIADLATGVYRFDRTAGPEEFNGELTDKGSIVRHLVRGSLELEVRSDGNLRIAADLRFSNDISVAASGVVAVQRVSAP
jgi:hypothetical protein